MTIEEWKDVTIIYPDFPNYQVSNKGTVRNKKKLVEF